MSRQAPLIVNYLNTVKINLSLLFFCFKRKDDIESKYYADGEDAFAMSRDLTPMAKHIEEEKKLLEKHRTKRLPGSYYKPPTEQANASKEEKS